MTLRFDDHGRFTIMQFNDTQDDHRTDHRTIAFMEQALDREKPNLVIINGDVIGSGPRTALEVYQAFNNVVLPMEIRGIAWAVTFGNHEEDSTEQFNTGVYREQMLPFLQSYTHNVNPDVVDGLPGYSNGRLVIHDRAGKAAFAVWLLDSGSYINPRIHAQTMRLLPGYDYLRPEQVEWYRRESIAAEEELGRALPGLMFFHIPTYEHDDMWNGGPVPRGEAAQAAAWDVYDITGERHESVSYGAFNSGIFSAVINRGDVRGIYCGHDHGNSYAGTYYGVELGYSPGTGFAPYGLPGERQHHLRGGRTFTLEEDAPGIYTETNLVFASEFNIDLTPGKQPIDKPADFPEGVELPEGANKH